MNRACLILGFVVGVVLSSRPSDAQTNSWTGSASGKWETGTNWSLGVPPTNTQSAILITNAGTHSVSIDATTTNFPGTMLVSNLTIFGTAGGMNTLQCAGAGTNTPLRTGALRIDTGGAMLISNAAVQIDSVFGGSFRLDGSLTVLDGGRFSDASFDDQEIGSLSGRSGTLTIAGGTAFIAGGALTVGAAATGTVWVTGGQLTIAVSTSIGGSGVGEMTVSNGAVQIPDVYVGLNEGSRGTLTISGGTTTIASEFQIGNGSSSTGAVWVTGGELTATNGSSYVGFAGTGQMTVSNGTWLAQDVRVGSYIGANGTLTIAGGTNRMFGGLSVPGFDGANGTAWITGGQLIATNAATSVGSSGVGQMTVSNGTVFLHSLIVGNGGFFSEGATLTVAGGAVTVLGDATMNDVSTFPFNTTGTVWLVGGRFVATNGTVTVGSTGRGQMIVSNAVVELSNVVVAAGGAARGALTAAAGTNSVYGSVIIGDSTCTAVGTAVIAGGRFYVTNATATATLDVRSGTLELDSGTLVVDRLILTNACTQFVRTGGTLIYGIAVLDPTRDDDGDSMPNGYEQSHGLDPLNAADAYTDADGDGQSNLAEYQAGTDPANSASVFRITEIAPWDDDIFLTWKAVGGKWYILQTTVGAGGSFSNNFIDLNPAFRASGTGETEISVLHLGAAANGPARFYRVRLVP